MVSQIVEPGDGLVTAASGASNEGVAMDQPKQYEIRTLQDFMQVPPDRLGACLEEFALMLAHLREVRASVAEMVAGLPGADSVLPKVECFCWRDDGVAGVQEVVMRVRLTSPVDEVSPLRVEWVAPHDSEGGYA